MKLGACHSSFRQGTKVIIHFLDDTKRIDKFLDKKRGVVIFKNKGTNL